MTYKSQDFVERMKKPVIMVAIIYSLIKFLNHFVFYPDYAVSRIISGTVLIVATFMFTRLNMSARMAAIVLPFSFVIIELTVVLLTGGDRLTYVFFIGTGMLSLMFVDTLGLVVKMLLTLSTVLFLLFGLDMRILWVDAPIADEVFNFLGTFVVYIIIFMLSKFLVSIAVAQLKEKDLFKIMIDTSPNVIAVMDMSGKVIDVNKAALEFYGYESKQDYMENFQKSTPKYQPNGVESIPFMLNFWRKVMEGGEVEVFSNWMRQTLSGEPRPTDVIVAPIQMDSKDCVIIHTVDLRERFKMEAALEEARAANLAKSQFLARMSHEIRTPMNAVMGMAELILRENISGLAREQAEIIKQSSGHLLSVINNILDLSKIESGKLELLEAEYHPASLINDLINITKTHFAGRELRFESNISSDIPQVLWGDTERVYQIIMNLLSNAVKYTDTGFVALDMRGERSGGTVNLIIKVRDSGRGIKEEDLAGLFEEFVRLDIKANKNIEGTGLGLAITRSLVHRMGGTIEAESTYCEGSTFTVNLPQIIINHENMGMVISPEQKPLIKDLHNFTAPDVKVLIVDDVQVNLKVADGLLKPYQMAVTLCESGRDAVEVISQGTFDLVLMDYMMPGMSGVETTGVMREMGIKIPIIALTANAIVGAKEMFLENGFDDFLSKPIDIDRLNKVLAKWIPKEKQQQVDFTPVADEAKIDIDIEGIDTAKGLALSGGNPGLYMDLITTFGDECQKKLDELTRCYEAEDIPLYTIHVHALKTACANIGADAVSKEAENLENAGNRRYIEFIRKHHGRFADNFARLVSDIKTAMANIEKPKGVAFDDDAVFSDLNELKTALEGYDVASIDRISENMQGFTQHPTYGEAVSEILRLTFVSKYKQAAVLLEGILSNR